ncbi:VirB4-like conjugal transfer ATPase, CD1110 family [Clostridium estertheticum]|uniref:VirB4-like conjugal transfer ATPase, CD1110 family n=1 Tax=Clostridium estertheticum TaxID=238834 RepID=UPI001C7DFD76|nr:hypothetical protein [Clostridium estertheticum]MBX4267187.1 hypothetical protein [Clostridium estertheticum]MBX4272069.1 hypothetical protein [Clostridium estertheticum]WLC82435.1 hypothetical protein KTC98_23955 [Clostridium estertheticum]WLC91309.1 hypothetical protein KTC95_23925 [Clostridium estertheticum]
MSRLAKKIRDNTVEMISILNADKMGIFQIEKNYYSATMKLSDVNYNLTREEEQTQIFLAVCQALNFIQEETLQINIINRKIKELTLRNQIRIKLKGDNLDDIREDLNDYMINTAIEGSGYNKEIYFTIKTKAKNMEEGKIKLFKTLNGLGALLKGTGCKHEIVSTDERLVLIHDLLRTDEIMPKYNHNSFEHISSFVAPREMSFKKNCVKIESKFHQTLEIARLPRSIRDSFIVDLLDLNLQCNISVNIKPIGIRSSIEMVETQMLNVETELINSQSKAMQNKRYNWIPPRKLTQQQSNIENIDSMIKEKNQKLFEINFIIDHVADNIDDIKKQKEEIMQVCGIHVVDLKSSGMLEEAFLSTIPIGNNYNFKNSMLFTTESLTALLIPFANVDFFDVNGTFMGINQTSRKPILVNRSELMSGGTNCILGVPGSGKSMKTKINIALEYLSNDTTEILLIDPEFEYTKLVEKLNGVNIKISSDSDTYLNCCDLSEKEKSLTGLKSKSEFLIILINTMMGTEGLTTIEQSLIDKAIFESYKPMFEHNFDPNLTPTLEDIRQQLLKCEDVEGRRIGKSIEIYTIGSLSLFSHKTNVNIHNRIINYDISSLNDGLKPLAYLNVLETIWQRVVINRKRGVNTYIVVDEAHLLLVNSYCEDYLQKSIKRWRKYGGYSDIISQNISEMLSRPKIATLISNSSILTLLNQSPVEKSMIEDKLDISPLQLSYVTNNEKGTGIMRIDGSVVPFDIRIPKQLSLYRLITTKFNEKIK